jgi:hypothetical protein
VWIKLINLRILKGYTHNFITFKELFSLSLDYSRCKIRYIDESVSKPYSVFCEALYTSKGYLIMSKEIRETPILTGKDVTRFEKMIKDNEKRKVSVEEYQKGKSAYEAFGFANK